MGPQLFLHPACILTSCKLQTPLSVWML